MWNPPELPFISVVMPVLNEGAHIANTLEQLLEQEYPEERYEILVVDGGSSDDTRLIVRGIMAIHPQVQLLYNPERRSSSGRNMGFQAGRGAYFVVIDGHCHIPSTQLLRSVADIFSQTKADCLGRPQPLTPPDSTPFQQAVALARASRIGHGSGSLIYSDYEGYADPESNGAMYSRKVFDVVGVVDQTFDACEDVEFNVRVKKAGLRTYTSPRLRVMYYPRTSFGGLFTQMARYGSGRCRLMRKHPDTVSAGTLVPPAFVLGIVITMLATLMGTYLPAAWLAALWSVWAVYAALLLVQTVYICRKHGWEHARNLWGIFPTIHAGVGWGFLRELIFHPGYLASPTRRSTVMRANGRSHGSGE